MDLDALLRAQQGLVTREQALRHLTRSALRHRLRAGGPWQRLHPAVYLTTTGSPTWSQLLLGALLHAGPRAQLSGQTALALHGLRLAGPEPVHVLVPHETQPQGGSALVVHRTHRLPPPVRLQGLPVSPVSRAVVDAARALSRADDVRALVAASVQRRRTTPERLREELEAGHSAGSALVRAVLEEVTDGVRSVPEAALRRLLLSSRLLPTARWNCRLLLHGRWLAGPGRLPGARGPGRGVRLAPVAPVAGRLGGHAREARPHDGGRPARAARDTAAPAAGPPRGAPGGRGRLPLRPADGAAARRAGAPPDGRQRMIQVALVLRERHHRHLDHPRPQTYSGPSLSFR